ncbi:MAG: tetratricopeptide repeat protein [Planctomycetes bacterium]|nr:tetratricopeptide repeat protein [Planctomycetota bacterium]
MTKGFCLLAVLFLLCVPLFAAEAEMPEAERLCRQGYQLLENNESAKAMALFDKAIEINPQYGRAYFLKGLVYSQQGELALAIKEYQQAIKFEPEFPNNHMNLGLCYLHLEQPEKAIAAFKVSYELDPRNPDICFNIALYHAYLEQYELAWWYVDHAQKTNGNVDPLFVEELAEEMPKPKHFPERAMGISLHFMPGLGKPSDGEVRGGFILRQETGSEIYPSAKNVISRVLKIDESSRKNGIWLVVTNPAAYEETEMKTIEQLQKLAKQNEIPFFICRGMNLPDGWYREN